LAKANKAFHPIPHLQEDWASLTRPGRMTWQTSGIRMLPTECPVDQHQASL
jgi:hypothetical protein